MSVNCKEDIVQMKKLPLILSMAFIGLFGGCTSENSSEFSKEESLYSGPIEGLSQKGPLLTGASVTAQELEGMSLLQTGKSFKGKIINDKGEFLIDNVDIDYPYVLLEANGYFRNEVTGKKSNGSIIMRAVADISDRSQVNINLLTHLEYERVQVLMKQGGMSIADAKRQAEREIVSAFFDLKDLEMSENLDIFGNSESDAALLAINILLLGNNSEGDFMERFAMLDQDLADNGVWDDSLLKTKIADDACKVDLMIGFSKIRKNMEDWKIADGVAPFESYVRSFWEEKFGLGKCDATQFGKRKKNANKASLFYGVEFACDSSKRWNANVEAVVAGCDSCGFVTDERDGHVYRTVKMAGIKWMSENLKFFEDDIVLGGAGAPKCYHGDCETYGYYYKTIGDICPEGWRLPTSEEYDRLKEVASADGYKELFSKTGWNVNVDRTEKDVKFATSTMAIPSKWKNDYDFVDHLLFKLSKYSVSIMTKNVVDNGEFFVRCVEKASAERKTPLDDAYGTYKDERNGVVYNTVKFGDQMWLAQNINYEMDGSVCMDNPSRESAPTGYRMPEDFIYYPLVGVHIERNSCRIGQLYTQTMAQSACPEGWRLPTTDDIDKLYKKVEGKSGVGLLFDYWIPNQNDTYSKYAMVTEYDYAESWIVSNRSHFWTSEPHVTWERNLSFLGDDVMTINPVRCVKDLVASKTVSSSSEMLMSSSSADSQSSSSAIECNAENEGLVETRWISVGNGRPPLRYSYPTYYRCEKGSWVERDERITCDTAGVSVGAACSRDHWVFGMHYNRVTFIYEGNGIWGDFKDGLVLSKECTAENVGSYEVAVYGNETGRVTELFKCTDDGDWQTNLTVESYEDYFCASKHDTCSFDYYDEKKYYSYFVYDEDGHGGMMESTYDPKLGYCPKYGVPYEEIYREVDGMYYHCGGGEWSEVSFMPKQLTDPRKEGLTDEEYDVLDLPKEATVGDIAGGLMENCRFNEQFELDEYGNVYTLGLTYDFCVSRHYYRFQEDGSWKLMTNEDVDSLDRANEYNSLCSSRNEGEEILVFSNYIGEFPNATYKCVSGDWKLVEYHFSRYKEK